MTPEEAMQKLLETLQLMQMTQIRVNARMAELTARVDQIEEMNRKIVFILDTMMDDYSIQTYH